MPWVGAFYPLTISGHSAGRVALFFSRAAESGWLIMPIGTIALWVAFKNVGRRHAGPFLPGGPVWLTTCGVAGDYAFIVRMLKPADGYYKLDVYLYYAPTFAIPLVAGWAQNFAWRGEGSAMIAVFSVHCYVRLRP